MKPVLLLVFALCAPAFFSGCASEWSPDELLSRRLQGRWCEEGYARYEPQPVFRDELIFNPDNSFSEARIWPNRPIPYRRTTVGFWTVSDGRLIQYWPRPRGQGYGTTTSTIVQARSRELVISNNSGSHSSYHRQPRLDDR